MHWVYHKEYPAKIVSSDEYEDFLREGWVDTPAKLKEEEVILDEEKELPMNDIALPKKRGRKKFVTE